MPNFPPILGGNFMGVGVGGKICPLPADFCLQIWYVLYVNKYVLGYTYTKKYAYVHLFNILDEFPFNFQVANENFRILYVHIYTYTNPYSDNLYLCLYVVKINILSRK